MKVSQFIIKYLAPFRWQIFITFIAITFISSAILGLGYALRYLIDKGFAAHDIVSLNKSFIMLLLMVAILSIASYARSIRINWICEQIEGNIKKDAYKNIISISPSYFDLHKVSDVISRLTSDLTLITSSIVTIASFSLRNILMAFGGMILLLINNAKLTSYVLLILPLILIPLIIIGRKIRQLSKENQGSLAHCNSKMEESLSFIKVVQAYNQEEFEYQRLLEEITQVQSIARKRIKLRSLLFALVIGLILSAVAFVLWVGGHDVLAGRMTAGSLSSFIFYSILVSTSIGGLSEVFSDWQRAVGALERIIEVTDAKSNVIDIVSPIKLDNEIKKISFDKVNFFYPTRAEIKILDDINIEIKAGTTTALVGPSGAGKSTFFQLLLRFYDPTNGSILLNDFDIKDISLDDLRAQFALVSQEPVIFSGTAYENISYGKEGASLQEVRDAAKAAEILDFLLTLPNGLDEHIGEKGVKLSGGQKQRIAIARAILRNPKILLLDEATSSLDSENEKLVQLALERLRYNRTTIVIAHRISTIMNADKIIVLDKGKIIAQGKHQELLKTCALYQRLSQDYESN